MFNFKTFARDTIIDEEQERKRLMNMSEREILIELAILMKKIDVKCDDIARKIVIWSN